MSDIEDYIIKTFQLLRGDMNPAVAMAELEADQYGVVVDEQGDPAALVVAEDLKQAVSRGAPSLLNLLTGLPPTVIVGCEVAMQDLAARDTTLKSFIGGARGAIVLDDERIVGVVPVQAVREYLGTGQHQIHGETMGPSAQIGDTGLGGRHGRQTRPFCRVTCAECGFHNELPFLDRRNLPPCKNPDPNVQPHTLKLT